MQRGDQGGPDIGGQRAHRVLPRRLHRAPGGRRGRHPEQGVYGLLFRAVAETLRTIAADPRHLGAEIGFFAVLHLGSDARPSSASALRCPGRRARERRSRLGCLPPRVLPAGPGPVTLLRALPLQGLSPGRCVPPEDHDPDGDRVHPAHAPPRAPARLPPHSLLRLPRQSRPSAEARRVPALAARAPAATGRARGPRFPTATVGAFARARLPPHTLRTTTAGRMACSARQLVASIDGSRRNGNTAGNSLARCLAKRLASFNGGGASISRPSRASSRPRSESRPCRVSSPFRQRWRATMAPVPTWRPSGRAFTAG